MNGSIVGMTAALAAAMAAPALGAIYEFTFTGTNHLDHRRPLGRLG